jgi:hypothetical protein
LSTVAFAKVDVVKEPHFERMALWLDSHNGAYLSVVPT